MSKQTGAAREIPEMVLDASCGGRSIWHEENKEREDTLYIDRRREEPGFHGREGRSYSIDPDEQQDFRDLPYPDESFNLVVFDPPHDMSDDGMEKLSGQVRKKYGCLHAETWQSDLRDGFEELWRVLRTGGTLVFKFADRAVDFRDVIDLAPAAPLFGTRTRKTDRCETRWFVFYKREPQGNCREVGGRPNGGAET